MRDTTSITVLLITITVYVSPANALQVPPARTPVRNSPARHSTVRCTAEDDLESWLGQRGVSCTATRAARLPGYGTCLVAAAPTAAGDTLLAVPRALHLTPSQLRASPLGAALKGVVDAEDESSLLALRVLQELSAGADSPWAPYMAMLPGPDDLHVPLLWSDEERAALLKGSHLDATVGAARAQLLAQWEAIAAAVAPSAPALLPPDACNAASFLWAHAIVLSRALPFGDELRY